MTIEVETPEIVTVEVLQPDGTALAVKFTRAEYDEIERSAALFGKSVARWIIDVMLEQARVPSTVADKRGLS